MTDCPIKIRFLYLEIFECLNSFIELSDSHSFLTRDTFDIVYKVLWHHLKMKMTNKEFLTSTREILRQLKIRYNSISSFWQITLTPGFWLDSTWLADLARLGTFSRLDSIFDSTRLNCPDSTRLLTRLECKKPIESEPCLKLTWLQKIKEKSEKKDETFEIILEKWPP